jgi:hypothetical protein
MLACWLMKGGRGRLDQVKAYELIGAAGGTKILNETDSTETTTGGKYYCEQQSIKQAT